MELRRLEHFLAVVEEGTFTAAAARLFMVQSSLSASLLALERELGTELFVRGRRGAELTDAGRALVGPARATLDQVDKAKEAVGEVCDLLLGTVRVAVAPSLPQSIDVCDTISLFHERHPGVEVRLVRADSRTMADLVIDGLVDFAITPWADSMSSGLHFEPLISTRLALVCPGGHRLAGADDVDPRELVDEQIIDLPREWQARRLFDGLMAEHGLERRARLEVDDWLGALRMAQRGAGMAYGPLACLEEELTDDLDVTTLAGAPLWEIGVATRDEKLRGAAGRAFLNAYLEGCTELPATAPRSSSIA
ncbi:LysR family transcriptional regulator [Blastococcus sp. CT_GayMR20]|uniref:LysR family transcriptional regulator n=1 Tax=Blastococcus sp. CT_GayMR20 TaxID=2559609 RepID=UPI0010730ED6|nr:LysR family transcriptional regulator [Blastococcus sp. CT_GayMR20]TFV83350.1 LysR family transcriptional regulator [Blastococcus sp. CT_GayMR20]